jgi:histidine triad (HIT) family protein
MNSPFNHFTNDAECIFCKIIARKIPARILYEDDDFLAFHDIRPAMPIHFLIIPKAHIPMLSDLNTNDLTKNQQAIDLLGKMLLLAPQLAKEQNLSAFKTQIHNGKGAGQEVFHLHLHVMGDPQKAA